MKRFNPWFIVSTLLLQIIVLAIINIELSTQNNISQLKSFLTFGNLALISLSILVIIASKHIFNNYRQQVEFNLLKVHLAEVQQLFSVMEEEKYKNMRHFNNIVSLLQVNQADKALDYTDKISTRMVQSNDPLPPIQNLGLYALLLTRQKIAERKGIYFFVAINCDINDLNIESWDLCAVVGNLLDNAIDATLLSPASKRYVNLEIAQEDSWFNVSVSNTGPRIKPTQKHRLFEPGYTTKGSSARGFGLYTVKRIVDQYGGAIDIVTDSLTIFRVYLPGKGVNQDGKRISNTTGT